MSFEISEHDKFLLLRLFGVVVAEDLMQAGVRLSELENAGLNPKNRITDMTAIEDLAVGFPEVYAVAKRRTEQQLAAPVRSAFVARRPIHVGFARMFQMLNENPKIELRIVESIDEAMLWFDSE